MKEKEKIIIESAIKFFATKGFGSTSIQEIANEAGISKGAFYLYFKSKESLLLATLKYYFTRIQMQMREIDSEPLPPRDKFIKQMQTQLSSIKDHKDFIIMQARENALPFNEDIEEFIYTMRYNKGLFYKNSLLDIYGDGIEPYIWDLTMIFQGLFHPYIELLMLENIEFDFTKLAEFMLGRMDDVVKGLIDSDAKEKAILSAESMENLIAENISKSIDSDVIIRTIHKLKESFASSEDDSVIVTLEVIEEEVSKEKPRIPVIKGMMNNLIDYAETAPLQQLLTSYYKIDQ
ncbi:TetR/AcrR family transcriptional regulator [Bacillus sp. SG-1]|uniref:TetR/AcrR family transcriptional regulator n=1 Tax=Bacillus sp. SG-1 TaxID=161544 RepID=UPI0001543155|nr:TetR/AcrR family transcriptional regulator [Bacillus sp. SG-1]EDL65241.1 Transcriptional regulator, TetR family protein [Bacillus sp. SG-1]